MWASLPNPKAASPIPSVAAKIADGASRVDNEDTSPPT